ncbi:hypothetical protein ZOSMA_26G00310 [Zostera marina]|uniref:Uncharacterized protein n=1 Tax=Zostera marina TaxID=29655 RepID=A0A0K9PGB5_ZOSMR|nr:hypothetical protein ZOSMA_26G00310 [Zostera marina]
MVASPYMSYIDNEPYYKKWGGQIVYLKRNLDLLEDDEVFVDRISFEKRMNVEEQMQKSDGVSATGSSSSASHDRNESVPNYVEDELMSLDSEDEESARKRKLKGKTIMIPISKKKIVQRHSSAKKNLVLDRREKQKAEVEAKYEEIFGQRVNTKKPKIPKKKKAPQDIAMLRRSSRLSGNSRTASGISPDSKYIIYVNMKVFF